MSELRPIRRESLDFVDRAPLRNHARVVVDAAAADVWPAIADAPRWAEWFDGVTEACWTSESRHGVGATRRVRVSGLTADEVVLAADAEQRFAFAVTACDQKALAAMVEVVTLTPLGERTSVDYVQALELAGPARLLGPLVRRRFAQGLRRGLAGLGAAVAHPR